MKHRNNYGVQNIYHLAYQGHENTRLGMHGGQYYLLRRARLWGGLGWVRMRVGSASVRMVKMQ